MTSELGQTTDPKVLIPGFPDVIEDHVATLRKYNERFDDVGTDLKKIDIVSWTGRASDAFQEMFSKEPPKWLKSCDALSEVSGKLTDYAGTLRWAQTQASQAISIWEESEAASKRASAEYKAAVDQADAQNRSSAKTGAGDVVSVQPFADPGEKLREEARAVLARARQQLELAGSRVARAIEDAMGSLVDAVTGGWKAQGKAEAQGPGAGFEASGPKDGKLGELKAFAQLAKASAEGSIGNELFKMNGKAEAGIAAETTLAAAITDEGVKARAEAAAGVKVSAEGRVDTGPLGVNAKGEGFAGGIAGAQFSAGPQGVNAKAEAFAGAKATGKVGADVGGIGVNATGEAWAGAGAEAGVTFGKDDTGKWKIGADAGVAEGLGGKVGFEVTVDPGKVSKTFDDAVDTVGQLGDAAGSAQKTISGWLD